MEHRLTQRHANVMPTFCQRHAYVRPTSCKRHATVMSTSWQRHANVLLRDDWNNLRGIKRNITLDLWGAYYKES